MEQANAVTGGAGVNVILEMLANVNLGSDLGYLSKGGRVVVIGSRGDVQINPRDLMARDAAILGMTLMNMDEHDRLSVYNSISDGLAEGVLAPVVSSELSLEDAPKAHHDVIESNPNGKIVLVP